MHHSIGTNQGIGLLPHLCQDRYRHAHILVDNVYNLLQTPTSSLLRLAVQITEQRLYHNYLHSTQ